MVTGKNMLLVLFFLSFIPGCRKDDDTNFVFVICKVHDNADKRAISNARVIYNSNEAFTTDENGEFEVIYNLGRLLADSVAFFATHPDYFPVRQSAFIGNTQKDIVLIELEHR